MGKLLQALELICCPVTEAPEHLLVNMSLMEELSILFVSILSIPSLPPNSGDVGFI